MKAAAAAEALPPALTGDALADDVTDASSATDVDPAPIDNTVTNNVDAGADTQKEVKMNVIGQDSQDAMASGTSLRGAADAQPVAATSVVASSAASPVPDTVDGGDSKAEDLASAVSKAVANKKLAE